MVQKRKRPSPKVRPNRWRTIGAVIATTAPIVVALNELLDLIVKLRDLI